MAALCDPAAYSFFVCGDFNQRLTRWGSRTAADLRWVLNDIEIRHIRVDYRHSRQLNELARQIAVLSDPSIEEAQLPPATDNEGVKPVIGLKLQSNEALALWLRNRTFEVERLTGRVPSIAVLVNGESEVAPLAEALDRLLAEQNLRAVACPEGRVFGAETDVRVFDIQHIKGLEFEAVFLIGLDRLAASEPDLFEKYLYVGATRAATYLGITLEGTVLPPKLCHLESQFDTEFAVAVPETGGMGKA
jgi:DNA helicase IV